MADFDADSVRGPNEIWKPQSPGYSDVLGIVGNREMYMLGGEAQVPGVEALL